MSNEKILASLNKLKDLNARITPPKTNSFYVSVVPFLQKTLQYIYYKKTFAKIKMKSLCPKQKSPQTQRSQVVKKEFLTPSRELPSSITYLNQSPFSDFGLSNPKISQASMVKTPSERQEGMSSKKKKFTESLKKLRIMLENSRPSISHKNFNDFLYYEMALNETCRVFRELKEKTFFWVWNRLFEFTDLKQRDELYKIKFLQKKREMIVQIKSFFALKTNREIKERGIILLMLFIKQKVRENCFHSFEEIKEFSNREKEKKKMRGVLLSKIEKMIKFKNTNKMIETWGKIKGSNYILKKERINKKNDRLLSALNIHNYFKLKILMNKKTAWGNLKDASFSPQPKKDDAKIFILLERLIEKQKRQSLMNLRYFSISKYKEKFFAYRIHFLSKLEKNLEISFKSRIFKKFQDNLEKQKRIEKLEDFLQNISNGTMKQKAFNEIKKCPKITKLVVINVDPIKSSEKPKCYIEACYRLLIILSRIHQNKNYLINSCFLENLKRINIEEKDRIRENSQKTILGLIQMAFLIKKKKLFFDCILKNAGFKKIFEFSQEQKKKIDFSIRNEKLGSILKRIFTLNKKICLIHGFSSIKLIKKLNILPNWNINFQNQPKKIEPRKNFDAKKANQISDIFAEKLAQIKKKFSLVQDKENSWEERQTPKKISKYYDENRNIQTELNPYFLKDDPIKLKKNNL